MPHRLPLVFAHGNGIPRPVYQKMLIGLSHRFIATGVDRFGHDPQYPVTESWPRLLDQLRSHIASIGEPVTLLGHGSGGWLSLLAAYRMPELVSAVILLDAPVPTVRQARLLGLLKQVGPGRPPRPVLRSAAPTCRTSIRNASRSTGASAAGPPMPRSTAAPAAPRAAPLRYRMSSGACSSTYPARAWRRWSPRGRRSTAPGGMIPCGMLVGEQSRVARLCGLAASRRLAGDNLVRIEGSHLFPLERPLVTAKEMVHLHDRMVGLDPVYGLPMRRWAPPGRSRVMQVFS